MSNNVRSVSDIVKNSNVTLEELLICIDFPTEFKAEDGTLLRQKVIRKENLLKLLKIGLLLPPYNDVVKYRSMALNATEVFFAPVDYLREIVVPQMKEVLQTIFTVIKVEMDEFNAFTLSRILTYFIRNHSQHLKRHLNGEIFYILFKKLEIYGVVEVLRILLDLKNDHQEVTTYWGDNSGFITQFIKLFEFTLYSEIFYLNCKEYIQSLIFRATTMSKNGPKPISYGLLSELVKPDNISKLFTLILSPNVKNMDASIFDILDHLFWISKSDLFAGLGGYERALNPPDLTTEERSTVGIVPRDLLFPLYGDVISFLKQLSQRLSKQSGDNIKYYLYLSQFIQTLSKYSYIELQNTLILCIYPILFKYAFNNKAHALIITHIFGAFKSMITSKFPSRIIFLESIASDLYIIMSSQDYKMTALYSHVLGFLKDIKDGQSKKKLITYDPNNPTVVNKITNTEYLYEYLYTNNQTYMNMYDDDTFKSYNQLCIHEMQSFNVRIIPTNHKWNNSSINVCSEDDPLHGEVRKL